MEHVSAARDDARGSDAGQPQRGQIRRYGVPAGLNPEEDLNTGVRGMASGKDQPRQQCATGTAGAVAWQPTVQCGKHGGLPGALSIDFGGEDSNLGGVSWQVGSTSISLI